MPKEEYKALREGMMESMGRITAFWGFSKVMGQLYGLLYLSSKPLTLDDMAKGLSVSKGNVSINVRALERWNMVKPVWVKGDRKDYYEAETDFWKIVKGVIKEREQKEFDQALSSVSERLQKATDLQRKTRSQESAFLVERLKSLEDFIHTMDKLVAAIVGLESLKRNFLWLSKGER